MSLYYAREHATNLGAESVTPEHLLLGMLNVAPEQINRLSSFDADCAANIRDRLMAQLNISHPATSALPLSPDTKRVLRCVDENDFRLRRWNIDVGHLLLGILSYDEEIQKSTGESLLVGRILAENGFDKDIVEKRVSGAGEI
jgi:ATP-dependent Clp protease ATP-binding subunit ClpA